MASLIIPGPASEVSDGFHTFGELYEHRCLLYVALMRAHPALAWRARLHADGSSQAGWWIGGLKLPTGEEITYHLPESSWSLLDGGQIETLPRAPKWDGHTSTDVVHRLRAWLEVPVGGF